MIEAKEGSGDFYHPNISKNTRCRHCLYFEEYSKEMGECHPDRMTILEMWPDGFCADEIAAKASQARENNGPGLVFEIDENPRGDHKALADECVKHGQKMTVSRREFGRFERAGYDLQNFVLQ